MSQGTIHFDRRETAQTPGAGIDAPQGAAEAVKAFGAAAGATDDRQDGEDVSGIAQDDDEVTEADPDHDDDEDALTDLGDETGAHV